MFSTRRTNPTDVVSIPVKSLAWMLLLRPGTLSVTIISSPDSIRLAVTWTPRNSAIRNSLVFQ